MQGIRNRSLSVITAVILVLSLFSFLTEGVLRATAAVSYYEQTFYSQRAGYSFVYTPKYGELDSCLRFSDGTQLSRILITSAKSGSTVSVVAEDTTYYYFAYWEDLSDSNNRKGPKTLFTPIR